MDADNKKVDVAIVGYGPVGAFTALLLAEEGLSVAVLERSPELVQLTQKVGQLAALGAAVSFSSETRNRLLLELGFDRQLADQRSAWSLAGA